MDGLKAQEGEWKLGRAGDGFGAGKSPIEGRDKLGSKEDERSHERARGQNVRNINTNVRSIVRGMQSNYYDVLHTAPPQDRDGRRQMDGMQSACLSPASTMMRWALTTVFFFSFFFLFHSSRSPFFALLLPKRSSLETTEVALGANW